MTRLARYVVHAFLILAGIALLARLGEGTARPGVQFALRLLLGDDHGLGFAFAMAAGLNQQRALLFLQALLTVLVRWPIPIETIPLLVIPITLGLAAGFFVSRVLAEAGEPVAPPAPSVTPVPTDTNRPDQYVPRHQRQ